MPLSARHLLVHRVVFSVEESVVDLSGYFALAVAWFSARRPIVLNEAHELAGNGRRHLGGRLAVKRQLREFAMEAFLRLPRDFGDARRQRRQRSSSAAR